MTKELDLNIVAGVLCELHEAVTALKEGIRLADIDSIEHAFTILDRVRGRKGEESFLARWDVTNLNPDSGEVMPNTEFDVPHKLTLEAFKQLVAENAEALDAWTANPPTQMVADCEELIRQYAPKSPAESTIEDLIQQALPKACFKTIEAALEALDVEAIAWHEEDDKADYLRDNLSSLRDALVVPHGNQDGESVVLTFVDDRNWQELKGLMSEQHRTIANQIDAELAKGEEAGTVVGNITPDGGVVLGGRAI